ncbi:peptide deformylase [endosymbiont of Sipalinus gigas]|uniref:peptide deformylase n=1 Tax=endosymbiont of Sipalinus gigas TaxID=1972134 RepID=UPI000DC6FEDE|nr:peptide deformylase [endosymbiont of Sipalinus gigas]BBA85237.1 peptide deformylase [endosymbiont of Sipalinus gigas]
MSILKILLYPDNRLRNKAEYVNSIDNNTQIIINNLLDTLYYNKGIGLSATQVNIHKKIIVLNIEKEIILINPELIYKSNEKIDYIKEGCLSIPNIFYSVPRYKTIKIKALDRNGNKLIINSKNNYLLSICIQHEIDHLNGKLFIDYLSELKKSIIFRKINKYIKINDINK